MFSLNTIRKTVDQQDSHCVSLLRLRSLAYYRLLSSSGRTQRSDRIRSMTALHARVPHNQSATRSRVNTPVYVIFPYSTTTPVSPPTVENFTHRRATKRIAVYSCYTLVAGRTANGSYPGVSIVAA